MSKSPNSRASCARSGVWSAWRCASAASVHPADKKAVTTKAMKMEEVARAQTRQQPATLSASAHPAIDADRLKTIAAAGPPASARAGNNPTAGTASGDASRAARTDRATSIVYGKGFQKLRTPRIANRAEIAYRSTRRRSRFGRPRSAASSREEDATSGAKARVMAMRTVLCSTIRKQALRPSVSAQRNPSSGPIT